MKRTIAWSFLLFANIILLVHAAVPHHHHENGSICFCREQAHHHEESPSTGKCCMIDHVYISEHNSLKTAFRTHIQHDDGQIKYALISNTLKILDFVDDTTTHFQQNPYVPLFYSDCISQSLGLRAPPAC